MKSLLVSLCVAAALLVSASASAGWQTGQVTKVIVRATDGLVYFYMSGHATDRAPCAAHASGYWMIRAEDSTAGKQQLAVLLLARASGQTISVVGSGTCARWPDGEDVAYVDY